MTFSRVASRTITHVGYLPRLHGYMQLPGSGTLEISSVLKDRTAAPPEEELEVGEVEWGGPSSFQWGSNSQDFSNGPNISIKKKDVPPPDPDQIPYKLTRKQEVERKEKTLRITGTGGAYVDFSYITEITMRCPDEDGYQVYETWTFKDRGGTEV